MLNLADVTKLYNEALFHTKHTPEIGGTLVGNCTTIHFGMLRRARELFGRNVQFTIGSITLNGESHFHFTSAEFQSWEAGNTKPSYNLHAWLSLPEHNNVIDLTLAATLNHVAKGTLPRSITFLTAAEATLCGIKHNPVVSGDDLVFRLNLLRSRPSGA